jgi:hypothetical protein
LIVSILNHFKQIASNSESFQFNLIFFNFHLIFPGFAGRSTPKSNQSPELSRLKPKVIISGTPSANKNCPSEARSSGSGESTPAGTIIHQKRRAERNGLHDDTLESKTESESSVIGGRKPSFRQYTMHLDRISSFEDDSFSSDLNHVRSIWV